MLTIQPMPVYNQPTQLRKRNELDPALPPVSFKGNVPVEKVVSKKSLSAIALAVLGFLGINAITAEKKTPEQINTDKLLKYYEKKYPTLVEGLKNKTHPVMCAYKDGPLYEKMVHDFGDAAVVTIAKYYEEEGADFAQNLALLLTSPDHGNAKVGLHECNYIAESFKADPDLINLMKKVNVYKNIKQVVYIDNAVDLYHFLNIKETAPFLFDKPYYHESVDRLSELYKISNI